MGSVTFTKRFVVVGYLCFGSSAAFAQLLGIHYDTGKLYEISYTGATTFLCDTGLVRPSSLAKAPNGEYYSFTSGTQSKLYRVNVTTGATTLVGQLGLGFTFEGGMAFDNSGNAYATNGGDAEDPKLFKINLSTGAATVVGRIGFSGAFDINGLVWDNASSLLVGINREANNLVFISPTDGSVGVGPTYDPAAGGPQFGAVGDMCNVPLGPFSLTYFATAGPDPAMPGDNGLWSLDIQSMQATRLGDLTGITGTGISGLAPVPEPATVFGLVLGSLFLARRFRGSRR